MLRDPGDAVSDDHRCDAIDGPRLVSRQQQELMCLRSAHVDCPRYRRAVATSGTSQGHRHAPAVPRAIAASLVILALSAGISFGFVMARGGIDLPAASGASAIAAVPSATAQPTSSGDASPAPSAASQAPSQAPTAPPTEPPSTAPTDQPSEAPTQSPAESPSVQPSPSGPAASGGPSASRLAVLKPCPNKSGCYIYAIRSGDNLFSIAHWFGVPLDTIYAWNPTVKKTGIHPGMTIRIPTPTR